MSRKAFGQTFYRQFATQCKKTYDAVIIGAGVMGLSCAYFLAKRINPDSVCVVERDLKVSKCFEPTNADLG